MAFSMQSNRKTAMSEINVTPLGRRDAGVVDHIHGYRAHVGTKCLRGPASGQRRASGQRGIQGKNCRLCFKSGFDLRQ